MIITLSSSSDNELNGMAASYSDGLLMILEILWRENFFSLICYNRNVSVKFKSNDQEVNCRPMKHDVLELY